MAKKSFISRRVHRGSVVVTGVTYPVRPAAVESTIIRLCLEGETVSRCLQGGRKVALSPKICGEGI